jgi:hypothetical protein
MTSPIGAWYGVPSASTPTGSSALIVKTDMTGLPAELASHKETTHLRPARHRASPAH